VDTCLSSFDIINAAKKYLENADVASHTDTILACTTISFNQTSHAKSLAASMAICHPSAKLAVLLTDEQIADAVFDELQNIVSFRPNDIGIKKADLHKLMLFASGEDLATKLVPAFGLFTLNLRPNQPLLLLSPETAVISLVNNLLTQTNECGVALVPWQTQYSPDKDTHGFFDAETDGLTPEALDVDISGTFNPGIVGVKGDKGADFLRWWHNAVKRNLATPETSQSSTNKTHRTAGATLLSQKVLQSLPYAQPYLDQAMALFSPAIVTDPGCGIGFWNLHQRPLHLTDNGIVTTGNSPISLMHFAGLDPHKPYILSAATSHHPRVLLSKDPVLRQLCQGQIDRLIGGKFESAEDLTSQTTFCDGNTLDDRMRRLLHRAILEEGFDNLTVGDPFNREGLDEFYSFLSAADPKRTSGPRVPGYLLEIYEERKDLALNFPRLTTVDALPYRNWVAFHGVKEEVPPGKLREILAETPWWKSPTSVFCAGADGLRKGVALTGYLRAEVGVGEAARLVLDALVGARIEVSPVNVELPTSRQNHPLNSDAQIVDRKINVIWMNAEHLLGFAALVGPEFFEGRYTVGGWAWETERLPQRMAANSDLVDEIWVPSKYVMNAVEPYVECPVYTFPHPITEPPVDQNFDLVGLLEKEAQSRNSLVSLDPKEVKSRFKFLYTFDFNSSLQRKNPFGVIEAFKKAFQENEGPILILKSVNGYKWQADLEKLKYETLDRSDIIILDTYLSSAERGALLNSCDCYVSLHRSEGFGLGMAEAMTLAKPVIATGYSGNLEFMDDTTAWLVSAEKVPVGFLAPPYDPDDRWGNPNLDEAAQYMRDIVSDPKSAQQKADRAKIKVLAEHGRAKAIKFLTNRIDEIAKLEEAEYISPAAAALRKHLL
jgi:glycosyltransferase involved in cell wall biosynthesis